MLETNNEDGTNTILDNIKYTKNHYERICNFYESQLIKYLCDNATDYPLLTSYNNGCNGYIKRRITITVQIYLGK